jgi:hypothetical protein
MPDFGKASTERDSRHTMRKVANDPFRRAMAKECKRWRKERGRGETRREEEVYR